MATVKLILDKRNKDEKLIDTSKGMDNNPYPLKLRIFHGDLYRDIPLNHKLKINEWVENRITRSYANSARANSSIQQRFSIANTLLSNFQHIIDNMDIDSVRELVCKEIAKQINPQVENDMKEIVDNSMNKEESQLWLGKFASVLVERKRKKLKNGTAKFYESGVNAIKKFNGGRDILIPDITISFLEDFEAEHIGKGNKKNAIGAYLRAIRAITNSAVKEVLKGERYKGYPWGSGGYSIPREKTKKRAVKKEIILAIRGLELEKSSALWDAKNYFLFMFNTRGMNFMDVAKMRKYQITNVGYNDKKLVEGRLEYKRSKNGKGFSIKLTKEALEILNAYNIFEKSMDDFVFPIGYTETQTGLEKYNRKRQRINERLRNLAKKVGAEGLNLTTYVVRHSWATIGKTNGLSIAMIGDGLGHEDTKTTETYLEDFANEVLDDANELIVS